MTDEARVHLCKQGNGGSDPILDPGFERGGWAMPSFEEESGAYVTEFCQRAAAFLYGRRTYDLFARYWGTMAPGSDPVADALSAKPKYVASTTLTDPQWAHTTVLSGDVAAAIGELRAESGGELQVELLRLYHELVDGVEKKMLPTSFYEMMVGQHHRRGLRELAVFHAAASQQGMIAAVVRARRDDQQRVDPAAQQRTGQFALALGVLAGGGGDEEEAAVACGRLDGLGDRGVERVGDVLDDEAQRRGAAALA